MSKRIIAILLACLFILSLSACGKKDNNKVNNSSKEIGVDEVDMNEIDDRAVEVDFETGSVISAPSDHSAQQGGDGASSSEIAQGGDNSDSTSSVSSEPEVDTGDDTTTSSDERDTMSGYTPWQ